MLQLRHHDDTRCHPIEPKPASKDVLETHPKGRVCPNDGTVLSIYNPNDFCWCCVTRINRRIANLN